MPQKKRDSKTSKGVHGGGGKVRLSRLQLALMGKGPTFASANRMYRDSLKNPTARLPKPDRS